MNKNELKNKIIEYQTCLTTLTLLYKSYDNYIKFKEDDIVFYKSGEKYFPAIITSISINKHNFYGIKTIDNLDSLDIYYNIISNVPNQPVEMRIKQSDLYPYSIKSKLLFKK